MSNPYEQKAREIAHKFVAILCDHPASRHSDWCDSATEAISSVLSQAVEAERERIARDFERKAQEHDDLATKHRNDRDRDYSRNHWAQAAVLNREAAAIRFSNEPERANG